MPKDAGKKPSRIQQRNRRVILDAALDVFSRHGYRGATLDQIATQAGLSKPNILYYFAGKEEIHVTLLSQLMKNWLDPLVELNADGDPVEEILGYVRRKLAMAQEFPRESRLFAGEILQGAPRIRPELESNLKPLFDEKCTLIQGWVDEKRLPPLDPRHLIFSIWARTQHYADFESQVGLLLGDADDAYAGAARHLDAMFRKLLQT
ncbi:TetR family transcriptional regulator C-terminal domain-containing protein [Sulfitobacter sp. M53]|uniref:TetR family transcriptional regulator C-terminal domain-containing protein n=1 Tax=Sulfitobacter sp. M53 TaxID=2731168 RepID=UPI0023E0EC4D|nr:TetR family transcriptional regulator C-terminal domain-containing protein [Sulfitobacter sp. M53]MDF3478044.1 TetR family transcriptional regulator [Sulfitobacter sp. M53]